MPAIPVPLAVEAEPPGGRRRTRLPGVDAMRSLAAFGVVVIHASLVVGGSVTPAAGGLSVFLSAWVVPFFLAAACFFAARAYDGEHVEGFVPWLLRNAGRLLLPYALWAAIYAGAKTVKMLAQHQSARAAEPWQDPAHLILTGGGAVALYFLPLVFVGLLVGRLLGRLPRRLPLGVLLALAVGATLCAEVVARSGNGFNLVSGRAFTAALGDQGVAGSGPVRIVLVLAAEAVRCLPYVLLAAVLVRVLPSAGTSWSVNGARAAGVAIFAGTALLPFGLVGLGWTWGWPEVLPGFGTLLLAWTFSLGSWPPGAARVAGRLGAWSFGVFLAHQLALEALQLALGRRFPTPAGLATLLAISLVAFVGCAVAIRLAEATGWRPLRRLFALPDHGDSPRLDQPQMKRG